MELAEKYGVRWLPSDFKKREGYKRSIELSREYGLYRQDYCGCLCLLYTSILPRRTTGTCAMHQRELTEAIKRCLLYTSASARPSPRP